MGGNIDAQPSGGRGLGPGAAAGEPGRVVSMDQFRGYTVLAMFLVNFLGGFEEVPAVLRHHRTYCSYADVVMPQFLFAVGFSLRLVVLKGIARHGPGAAYWRGVKRAFALVLFGLLFYRLDGQYRTWEELHELGVAGFFTDSFRRSPFQTLTHIGVTSLWVLPVVARGAGVRLAFLAFAALLHVWLSHAFWYDTLHRWTVIDGGLLGFLTWTVPAIAGTFAYDWVKVGPDPRTSLRPPLAWGAAAMAAGYAVSCLGAGGHWAAAPFNPPLREVDMWTMSQRSGSVSYLLFATGFSMASYAVFVWLCDLRGRRWTAFDVVGRNAFAAYVLHMITLACMGPFGPRDAPLWYALAFAAFGSALGWWMTLWCNRRGLFLRL